MVKTKNQIRKMIDQELEFADFKTKITEEQAALLLEESASEVQERSSYFFKYDSK